MPWAATETGSWARKRPRVLMIVIVGVLCVLYLIRAHMPLGPRAPEDWTPEMEERYAKKPAAPLPAPGSGNGKKPVGGAAQQTLWRKRAERVRNGFLHAYHGYEKYAHWPDDELKPNGNRGEKSFNAWGVTVVDSISTMVLMSECCRLVLPGIHRRQQLANGLDDAFLVELALLLDVAACLPICYNLMT